MNSTSFQLSSSVSWWGLFQAGKISDEEAIDKSRNPGAIVDKMQKAGHDVENPDEALMAEVADANSTSGAAPAGAAKPAGGSSEAERQAAIAANRARMMAAKK